MQQKGQCGDCGAETSYVTITRCRPCYHATREKMPPNTCTDCGTEIRHGARRCKPCNDKNMTTRTYVCPDCHGPKAPGAVRCLPCSRLGRFAPNYNREYKEETGRKISESILAHYDEVGRKSPGNRDYYDYKIWRKGVLEHDGYICQHCGSKENLRVHHMEDYINNPDLRTELSNGITFCKNCHKQFHHLLGKQSTRASVFWFLKNVQLGK